MIRYLMPFFLFGTMVVFFVLGLGGDPRRIPSPFIDKPAPKISLARLDDPEVIFTNRDLLGKVTLVNVWSSWCGSCEYEHPLLNYVAANTDVQLVGINYKDKRADALAYLQKHGNPYHAIPADVTGLVGIDWGVYGVPETFVVDKEGIVKFKYAGPISGPLLKNDILPLIQALQAKDRG